jgi:hypothetical protein
VKPNGKIPLAVLPVWAEENSCLRAAAEIRINATVIHSSNLRRVNPVASMATVKRAWWITKARREEESAEKN